MATKWFDTGGGRKAHYYDWGGRSLCGSGFFHVGARYLTRTPSVDWQCKRCRKILHNEPAEVIDRRQGWLKELKKHSVVRLTSHNSVPLITTVAKITPTGKIDVWRGGETIRFHWNGQTGGLRLEQVRGS